MQRPAGLPLLGLRVSGVVQTSDIKQDCRSRRPPFDAGPSYMSVPQSMESRISGAIIRKIHNPRWSAMVPGAFFLVSMIGYLLSGFFCTIIPPTATTVFDDHEIPSDATCLRVTRHTSYTTVDLPFGTPSTMLDVLLRLDVVNTGTAAANTRLFSTRIGESESVVCDGSVCSDVVLLHEGGPNGPHKHMVMKFLYTNPTTERLTYGTATTIGLDGEMTLAAGYDYYLTATHLCWKAVGSATTAHSDAEADADGDGGVPARVVGGLLRTNASNLIASSVFRDTPVGKAQTEGTCTNTTLGEVGELALFPGAASNEASWLGLASSRVYETSPDGVGDRRIVVEVGTTCAASHPSYERAYSLYQLDCLSVYTPCETYPTVPFRRVADTQLRFHISADAGTQAYVWAVKDLRLTTLPKLKNDDSSLWLGVLKLSLMTLAAAVTWVRAAKSTSSHDRLFMFCIRTARCHIGTGEDINKLVIFEDAAIGFAAWGARLSVAVWRTVTLWNDGLLRAPMAQLIASILSCAQWVIRYLVLESRCEAPLTKLGGSTALVDATCAVMLGFAEPPLLVSSSGRFDPTARLLTALLITTMTLQRCLFATACCGLLWAVAREDALGTLPTLPPKMRMLPGGAPGGIGIDQHVPHFDKEYGPLLFFASFAWVLQTCSVGILLADVFCSPLAYSMSRMVEGSWSELSMAIFFAVTAASLPQMMRTAQRVAEDAVVNPHHAPDPAKQ